MVILHYLVDYHDWCGKFAQVFVDFAYVGVILHMEWWLCTSSGDFADGEGFGTWREILHMCWWLCTCGGDFAHVLVMLQYWERISLLSIITTIIQKWSGRKKNLSYCLQWTPKSSILFSGMVWYSEGPSSGGLYPCHRERGKLSSLSSIIIIIIKEGNCLQVVPLNHNPGQKLG